MHNKLRSGLLALRALHNSNEKNELLHKMLNQLINDCKHKAGVRKKIDGWYNDGSIALASTITIIPPP